MWPIDRFCMTPPQAKSGFYILNSQKKNSKEKYYFLTCENDMKFKFHKVLLE